MSNVPAVSVVIPLYNKAPYIARALNSVLAQTFQDIEVIVVDDGSTDDGAEVVRQFDDPRIRLIQQENRGVSAARNRGIEAARAELVAFLDADDEWLPGFVETVLRLRRKFPEAGVYATAISTAHNGTIKHSRYRSVPSPNWEGMITDYFRSLICGDCVLCSSSVAIPRDILQEMNGFITGAKWGEDLDLWGRIGLRYPIGFSALYCSVIHVTSKSSEKIYSRVTITRENPFIKSARTAIKGKTDIIADRRYLMLYLEKIIIESAIYNVILGRKDESKEILGKCNSKAFFLTKISLNICYAMPECVIKMLNNVPYNFLLIIFSYLKQLELLVLGFIAEHERVHETKRGSLVSTERIMIRWLTGEDET